jgi:thioredoxin 1
VRALKIQTYPLAGCCAALTVTFSCNKENKDLGKALAIRVAPTFHLYRNSKQLAVLTGAKETELRALIELHM